MKNLQAFVLVAALILPGAALASSTVAPNHDGMNVGGQKQALIEVIDPVCGMKVSDPKTAPRSLYEGKAYYFCSQEDKAKFDKNPAVYLKKKER